MNRLFLHKNIGLQRIAQINNEKCHVTRHLSFNCITNASFSFSFGLFYFTIVSNYSWVEWADGPKVVAIFSFLSFDRWVIINCSNVHHCGELRFSFSNLYQCRRHHFVFFLQIQTIYYYFDFISQNLSTDSDLFQQLPIIWSDKQFVIVTKYIHRNLENYTFLHTHMHTPTQKAEQMQFKFFRYSFGLTIRFS